MDAEQKPKPLSLRPWPTQAEEEPLDAIITRIHEDRGGFRLVTEDALEREIAEKRSGLSVDEDEEDTAAMTRAEALEKLHASKREILTFAQSARLEVGMALDLVSLLLSKEHPKAAEASLSPEVKKRAPLGSIGYDIWNLEHPGVAKPTPRPPQEERLVARGARIQSLMFAADSLLQGASRLKDEVERETKYWQEVLSVKEKGWAIHRVTTENSRRSALGVEISALDAGAQFRSRFAVFQRSDDGRIRPECNVKSQPRTLCVSLLRKGKVIGTSISSDPSSLLDDSLESKIHRMRDALFDEELFFELTQEVRNLLPFGATLNNGCISLPAWPLSTDHSSSAERDCDVIIELVPLDSQILEDGDFVNGDQARAIAMFLRLMLMHGHATRHRLRTQIPDALQEKKQIPPPPTVLQPLVTHLHHMYAVKGILGALTTSSLILSKAGIETTLVLKQAMSSNLDPVDPVDANGANGAKPIAATERICRALAGVQETCYRFILKDFVLEPEDTAVTEDAEDEDTEYNYRNFDITIRTDIGKFDESTEYVLSSPQDQNAYSSVHARSTVHPLRFQNQRECVARLREDLSRDIAHRYIPHRDPDARIAAKEDSAAYKMVGEKGMTIFVDLDKAVLKVNFVAGPSKIHSSTVTEWTAGSEKKDLLHVIAEEFAKLSN
ncbi:hypothetical protein P152DRAFT_480218 [Eremomyces bilateralis CBS 781.70]|uniref:Mediator of RNA polymerase II transcription subunit 17 n=1 Tax=Eremomyces bilateralis CBS 781.70 TaxID=1392243 RepID=A0A6G1GAX3_9PEZI|nr:uncharacterized protein P152DRAFT_480218 [Eremomyces bilateralis CBS 781.70]KAF1815142.1 hypothetical protein P152DRAFT_480218 [Eremomyces bilateralis CBS 781.70]